VLALGIGANAAMFSLINALLLRPLNGTTTQTPMGVFVGDRTRPDAWRFFSYPEYIDVRQQTGLFTSVIAETGSYHPGLDENGRTRRISARVVSSNYFAALGGTMAAGRGFTAAEDPQCRHGGRGRQLSILAAARLRSGRPRPQPAAQRDAVHGRRRRPRGVHRPDALDVVRRVAPLRRGKPDRGQVRRCARTHHR
jgi:hypothetical protein